MKHLFRRGRHQATRTNVTAYMEARARGGHTTTEDGVSILPRRSAHSADAAVLGLHDYEDTWDELATARGFDPYPGGVLAGGGDVA